MRIKEFTLTLVFLLVGWLIVSPAWAREEKAGEHFNAKSRPGGDSYQLQIKLDPDRGRLDGQMVLRYRNNSGASLDGIRLRLDANMGNTSKQLIEILSIQDAEDRPLVWRYERFAFGKWESDKGQVEVTLPKSLPPANVVELRIKFSVFGIFIRQDMITLQDDPFQSLDGWYPKAMTKHGDEWSSDDDRPSNYEATVDLPEKYVIASTGELLDEKPADSRRIIRLKAEGVRGFTIYGNADWKKHHRQADGVELNIYLPAEAEHLADQVLSATADAIAFYRKEYGEFPTRHLDIVCLGGMNGAAHGSSAACNVITLFLGGKFEEQYRWLTAHEAAHQYFGSSIGLPRKSLGWAPIGLGMMMDGHYMKDRGLQANWGRLVVHDFYFKAEQMGFDTTLSQSLEKPLKSPPPWSFGWNMSLMHGKAYSVCSLLQDLMGAEKFQGVIRKIIAERAGDMIDGADLIDYCQSALGERLDWFVADWVDGRATLDYAISSVKQSDGGWRVEVTRIGAAGFPVLAEAETVDGQKLFQRVDRQKKKDILFFKTANALKTVMIDPDVYSDIDPSNNFWPRKPKVSDSQKHKSETGNPQNQKSKAGDSRKQ